MSFTKWLSAFPVYGLLQGFAREFIGNVIIRSAVPQHVAFIMDGNRRFANKNGLELGEGHVAGFESLGNILEVLYNLGVHSVTVYAFSIENFNRPPEEIDSLFNIIRSKLLLITEKDSVLSRYGISVRFIGNRDLIPEDIMVLIESIEEASAGKTRGVLNIAFSYTSRDDIAAAMRRLTEHAAQGIISTADIDMPLLEKTMYTGHSPPLDIMVRTSGETRLSDYMIWQSVDNCAIEFIDTLWPDINSWDVFKIIFKWGYNARMTGRVPTALETWISKAK